MNANRACTLFTALIFATGLLIGFLPINRYGIWCGSAFHGTDAAQAADFSGTMVGAISRAPEGISIEDTCKAARSTVAIVAIPLVFFGFAAFIGTAVITARRIEEKK